MTEKLKKKWFVLTHPNYVESVENTNAVLLRELSELRTKMDVEEELWEEQRECLMNTIHSLENRLKEKGVRP